MKFDIAIAVVHTEYTEYHNKPKIAKNGNEKN